MKSPFAERGAKSLRGRRQRRWRKLIAERLEDRCLLAAISGIPEWLEAGPAPVLAGNNHPTLDETPWDASGAIQAVAVDWSDPNTAMVASVNGGIWKTERLTFSRYDQFDNDADGSIDEADEQPTWAPLSDDTGSLSFGALAQDPVVPTTWYAGNAHFSSRNRYGTPRRGVWRSIDDGATWVQLATQSATPDTKLYDRNIIGIHARGATLLVGTQEGGGVYRSADGGLTWTRVSGSLANTDGIDNDGDGLTDEYPEYQLPDAGVTDLVGDPGHAARFYASVLGEGIFRSDDSGVSWRSVSAGLADISYSPFVGLAVHHNSIGGTNAVYAAIAGTVTNLVNGKNVTYTVIRNVVRSTNAGGSWTTIGTHPDGNLPFIEVRPAFRHYAMAADPADPHRVALAGVGGNYLSTFNAGTGAWTWEHVAGDSASKTGDHSDHRAMAFDLQHHLLVCGDGGIYRLRNPGAAGDLPGTQDDRRYEGLNNNLRITETADRFSLAYDRLNNLILLGTQDNGSMVLSNPHARGFADYTGGDGNSVAAAIEGTTAYHYLLSNNYSYFRRHKRDDQGKLVANETVLLASPATPQNHLSGLVRGTDSTFRGDFLPGLPFVLNAITPSRMALGTSSGLYESSNRGDTVVDITPGATDRPVTAIAYGGRRSGVDNADVLYAGISGRLWVRTSGSGAPAERTAYATAGGGKPWEIVLDPDDWQTAYVLDETGRIWRTTDGGATVGNWQNLTQGAGLPQLHSIALAVVGGSRVLLAAGEGGVFRRINPPSGTNATSWSEFGRGIPDMIVYDVLYDPTHRVLLAATQGRGVWRINSADQFLAVPGKLTVTGDRSDPGPDGKTYDSPERQDQVRIARNPLRPNRIDVFLNPAADTSPPTYTLDMAAVSAIEVDARQGNDFIQVDYLPANTALTIRCGNGSDVVFLPTTEVAGSVAIYGDTDPDWFAITRGGSGAITIDGGTPTTMSPPADVLRTFGSGGSLTHTNIEQVLTSGPTWRTDRLEPNDSSAAAYNLVAGDQTHTGLTIHEANNNDWYKWTASQTGNVGIELRFQHELGDVELELYQNPAGSQIAASRSSTDDEYLRATVQAGVTYYIRVWGHAGATNPDYSLEIDWPFGFPDDSLEQNDAFAQALHLDTGDQQHENLAVTPTGTEFVEDEDWYRWRATASGWLTVDLKFDHELGNLDLQLLDASQVVLSTSDTFTDDEELMLPVQAGNDYTIRVYGFAGATHPDYDLFIDGPEISMDNAPPNPLPGLAWDLGSGDQQHMWLSIDTPGVGDYFRWRANAVGQLTVDITFAHDLGDLDLELLDENLVPIASSAGSGDLERVSVAAQSDQVFLIHVYGYQDATNYRYDLDITWPPAIPLDTYEPNESLAAAADLGDSDFRRDRLTIHPTGEFTSSDDWYRWQAAESGPLSVDLDFIHAAGDVELRLLDAAGQQLAYSAYSENGEHVSWDVQAEETYYIHVYGYQGARSPEYELRIDGPDVLPDVLEPNDSFTRARNLRRGDQDHRGLTLHEAGNEDWYLWTATVAGSLRVGLAFDDDRGNIDLEVRDLDRNLMGASLGNRDRESVTVDVDAGQSVYLRVWGTEGTNPDYRLEIDGPEVPADGYEANDTIESPTDLGSGNVSLPALTIHAVGNSDWYRWMTPVSGSARFAALFSQDEGDVQLELYAADGRWLAESVSTTDDEEIGRRVSAGETYHIRVFGQMSRLAPPLLMEPKYFIETGATNPNYELLVDFTSDVCSTQVINTDDAGPGSLRAAIDCSNLTPGVQTISFDIPGPGPHVIQPLSALPELNDAAVIDGTTEPDFAGMPVVELVGTSAGDTASGLRITGGGTTVRGLAINRFGVYGIEILRGGGNQVQGNCLGTNPAGTVALGNLNYGISVTSAGNRIGGPGSGERNLISGNLRGGVRIAGAVATGNVVQGNYVGTDITGTLDLGNREAGVAISGATNLVGGELAGEGNLLSGNDQQGLALYGTHNTAYGNRIGTNAAGTGKLANHDYGIAIYASSNQIGGVGTGKANVISGNRYGGILIRGATTAGNKVQGNRIGTDPTGTLAVGNTLTGVAVDATPGNLVGGSREEGNLLSGNGREGVSLYQPGNLVMGNLIGTQANGMNPLGNGGWGMYLVTYGSRVGGTSAGEAGNVISANGMGGIQLYGSGAHDNQFHANLIGLNADGTQPLANQGQGIFVNRGYLNEIGGSGAGNTISGNAKEGVWISGGPATNNKLWGNRIGTNAAGTAAQGNSLSGVRVTAVGNFIGGSQPGQGNVISGNREHGVLLQGDTSSRNTVRGNWIGMDAGATLAIPNALHGVAISGAQNTVGGVLAGEGNVIGRNSLTGVSVIGDLATRNAIQRNSFIRNVGMGIDLVGGAGPTPNDVNDPDAGANRLQNYPVIASAVLGGGNLQIAYQVPTALANATYPLRVEFFVADADHQEGQQFLGSDSYAAPGVKNVTIAAGGVPVGARILATATDAQGNTSEFSPSFVTTAPPAAPLAEGEWAADEDDDVLALDVARAGSWAPDEALARALRGVLRDWNGPSGME